jgi:hypothetical protein
VIGRKRPLASILLNGRAVRAYPIFFAWMLLGLPALAAPLRAKNGQTVRLRLGSQHERGIGLKPGRPESGWRLVLAPTEAEAADVVDVTVGAPANKWTVAVVGDALMFDASRFVPDHAYRVELRRGARALGSALVYLYPPPEKRGKQQLVFDSDEAPADDDGIAVMPKSAL